MKSIIIKIFLLAVLFSIKIENSLLAQCASCPVDVMVNEAFQMTMIMNVGTPMIDVTVYDENGDLCGIYTPTIGTSTGGNPQPHVWVIQMGGDCPNITLPNFTGTLFIGTVECNMVAGQTEECNQECADCPLSFEYDSPYGGLVFELDHNPAWAVSPVVYYVKSPGSIPQGPFALNKEAIAGSGTKWSAPLFPITQLQQSGGSLVFGPGLMQCNYHGDTFVSCAPSNPGDCQCPHFRITQGYLGHIFFGFENSLPYYPPNPVKITLDWAQNSSGPYLVNWLNQNPLPSSAWRIDMMDPLPPNHNNTYMLYNGTLTMNGEITCTYKNSVPIGCEETFFGEPECSQLAMCEDELEGFVLNLPGSGCAKWKTSCNSYSSIHRFGDVSIGSDGGIIPSKNKTPNGYNLSVTGGIMTDFIRVELCGTGGWCDYVFSENYNLKPLIEIENHIAEKGHLPNSLSEKNIIEKGGIEVKEVMINHQEKIEELFLYLIELDSKIKNLEKEIKLKEIENNILKVSRNF